MTASIWCDGLKKRDLEIFFYTPNDDEWLAMRGGKIPDLEAPITTKPSLDTLYSLLADADFEKYQEDMDREMMRYL